MIGLVLVSHSAALAEGTRELAMQMSGDLVSIAAAGGTAGGVLGTNPDRIGAAIQEVMSADGVLVLMDLGSAILSTETALELLPPGGGRVLLSNAPFVEGAVIAAVEASLGRTLDEVNAAAEAACAMPKVSA